jgi:hypothetical protein
MLKEQQHCKIGNVGECAMTEGLKVRQSQQRAQTAADLSHVELSGIMLLHGFYSLGGCVRCYS